MAALMCGEVSDNLVAFDCVFYGHRLVTSHEAYYVERKLGKVVYDARSG